MFPNFPQLNLTPTLTKFSHHTLHARLSLPYPKMVILTKLTAAHAAERRVFARILDIDMEVNKAKRIISYLMYLESIGCKNLMKNLASRDDDNFLSLVCAEAEHALSSLDQPFSSPIPFFSTSPLTFSLVNLTFSLFEIFLERESLSRSVSQLYNGVSSIIFEDILEERGLRRGRGDVEGERGNENGKRKGKEASDELVRASGEGSSQQRPPAMPGSGGAATDGGNELEMGGGSVSNLNPDAEEWRPWDKNLEDGRCLFITFSKGYPLSHNQIWLFFTWNFGPYVEKIYIHQRPRESFPLFGKIVFRATFVPMLILNGRDEVKFVAFGRTIWCKKYRRNNNPVP